MPPSKLVRYTCIPGMLLFGTCTVVTQKIIFKMESTTKSGETKSFKKPWFQTEMMFVGMMLCLVVYEAQRIIEKYRKVSSDISQKQVNRWKEYLVVMVPALCDMVATCMMNVGLVYISASIWQMMRGSMIIFSTIFTIVFLKKKKYAYHWVSVIIACSGLIVVALASLKIPDVNPAEESSVGQKIMALSLVVGAQIVQASQIVFEEYLLGDIQMDASFIVGLEGFWGTIVCGLFLIPIGYAKSWEKFGFYENTIESFYMMKNNTNIIYAILLYIFFILCYNLYGMMVTQTYSAIYRTILEAVRTACIWVTNLIIHKMYSQLGEVWVAWSWLELFGFLFILTGSFLYNKVIRIPWFDYPDDLPTPLTDEPLIVKERD